MTSFEKNKIFGILTTTKDINKFYNQQKNLCDTIVQKYNYFYIIDLSNFLILKNNKKQKISLPKNFIYFKPKNFNELKDFIGRKKIIAFNNLGKTFNYFFIYLIINLLKIRLVLLFNLGDVGNSSISVATLKSKILRIKNKIDEFIYKVLIFFKILPQIDLYFHTDKILVKKINKINKIRTKLPFNKLFNYTYIKKSSLVSTRKNNFKIKKKYIIFIDSNFYHPDRLLREKKPSISEEKNYFENLKYFFELIEKRFNKKVFLCLHPSSNIKVYKKYFSNKILKKGQSHKMVAESFLIFAHESSLIIDSINLLKPIIILKSNHLGDYIKIRCNNYINIYKLKNISIDLEEKFLNNEISKLKKSRFEVIKKIINIISNDKIVKQMENID